MSYLRTRLSEIKAAPIKGLFLYSGIDENQIDIVAPNIMKESNVSIDPVTARTDRGGEISVGYKLNASIYFISNSKEVRNRLKILASLNGVSGQIHFGGDGFASVIEDNKMMIIFQTNKDDVAIKVKEESMQGFYRYNIVVNGIMRTLPDLYTQD